MRISVACTLIFGLMLLGVASGCSSSKTGSVQGKVVFKGKEEPAKELEGYHIAFELIGERPVSASGVIEEDGTFQMSTYEPNDGAVPGKHKVSLVPPEPVDIDAPPKPWKIDKRYANVKTSDLTVEIKPGSNDITLELDPAK